MKDFMESHADYLDTIVTLDRGQWAVDIVAYFPDCIVRKRISTYRTKQRAYIAASAIEKAANRDMTP